MPFTLVRTEPILQLHPIYTVTFLRGLRHVETALFNIRVKTGARASHGGETRLLGARSEVVFLSLWISCPTGRSTNSFHRTKIFEFSLALDDEGERGRCHQFEHVWCGGIATETCQSATGPSIAIEAARPPAARSRKPAVCQRLATGVWALNVQSPLALKCASRSAQCSHRLGAQHLRMCNGAIGMDGYGGAGHLARSGSDT
jgi:hypothetical protein